MKICCIICWEAIELSSTPSVIKCGHMFHNECLLKWFTANKTCPQCRIPVFDSKELVTKVYFETGPDAGLDDSNGLLKMQLTMKEVQLQSAVSRIDEFMLKSMDDGLEIKHLYELRQKDQKKFDDLKFNMDMQVRQNKKLIEQLKAYQLKEKERSDLEIVKTVNMRSSSNDSIDFLKKQNSLLKTEITTLKMRIKSLNLSLNKHQRDSVMDDLFDEMGAASKPLASRKRSIRSAVKSPVTSPVGEMAILSSSTESPTASPRFSRKAPLRLAPGFQSRLRTKNMH